MKIPKLKKKTSNKSKKKVNKKNLILIILISMGICVTSLILAFSLFIIITSPDFIPKELYT